MANIHYLRGDIFDSKAQVIVNTVNTKGVMGKGLALLFKERYPDMFAVYQQDCKSGRLRIGKPTLYKRSNPWILNFPTKDHWRFPSKIEYLEKGLAFLVNHYQKVGIASIAFPKLGAQNGKLSWDEVGPLMAKYLSQLDIDVYIYIADGDKEYQYDPVLENKIQERIWREFNELAISADRLTQQVGLSHPQANILAKNRQTGEFRSLADIERIEKLAKISLKKIKVYIDRQRLLTPELPGLSELSSQQQAKSSTSPTKRPRSKRNKQKIPDMTPETLLIPEMEPIT